VDVVMCHACGHALDSTAPVVLLELKSLVDSVG
jgi:hypothetical protein